MQVHCSAKCDPLGFVTSLSPQVASVLSASRRHASRGGFDAMVAINADPAITGLPRERDRFRSLVSNLRGLRPVLLRHAVNFNPSPLPGSICPHDRLVPDCPFWTEKIELGFHSHRPWTRSSPMEQTPAPRFRTRETSSYAITTPIDP